MNPRYLWLPEGLELLAFFVIQPVIAIAIAYRAWRGGPENAKRYRVRCLASGVTALLLVVFAKFLHADVESFTYFLQVACLILGFMAFGICVGCGLSVFLSMWHWHKNTRLS